MVRAFDHNFIWVPSIADFFQAHLCRPRSSNRGYISHLALTHLRVPQEQLEGVAGENNIWTTLPKLLSSQPNSR